MASYGGLAGLLRRRLNPNDYGTMTMAGSLPAGDRPVSGGGAPSYYNLPGSGMLPGGNLRVSPSMGGTPRSMPGIDIPMGQRDPSVLLDPRYADNIGLGLNPQVDTGRPGFSQFFRYLTDPGSDPGQGGGGPGQNIPPNEDVAPPNNDYYYANDVYAPGGGSGSRTPSLRDAPPVTPEGYIMPGSDPFPSVTPADSYYPMPGGWSRKMGSSFDPNTGMNWVNNATNTDARGYPIPGVGGTPAGDWRSNASRPPVVMTNRGPMGRGSFGSTFGVMGRGYAGPYGGGNSFGQGVGDTGINPSGNWGAQSWSVGGMSQANLSLGIDPGAMMYRGHLAS